MQPHPQLENGIVRPAITCISTKEPAEPRSTCGRGSLLRSCTTCSRATTSTLTESDLAWARSVRPCRIWFHVHSASSSYLALPASVAQTAHSRQRQASPTKPSYCWCCGRAGPLGKPFQGSSFALVVQRTCAEPNDASYAGGAQLSMAGCSSETIQFACPLFPKPPAHQRIHEPLLGVHHAAASLLVLIRTPGDVHAPWSRIFVVPSMLMQANSCRDVQHGKDVYENRQFG